MTCVGIRGSVLLIAIISTSDGMAGIISEALAGATRGYGVLGERAPRHLATSTGDAGEGLGYGAGVARKASDEAGRTRGDERDGEGPRSWWRLAGRLGVRGVIRDTWAEEEPPGIDTSTC